MTRVAGQIEPGPGAPHRLFVLERPIVSDRSATFTLRSARAASRRGEAVVVFLLRDALPESQALNDEIHVIRQLLDAGVVVYADGECPEVSTGVSSLTSVRPGTEEILSDLLLLPGVQTTWC